MINYNGDLFASDQLIFTPENRAFKYGDAVFEILKIAHGKVIFWEDHYFRLMASMRMLRMKIPIDFTLEFLEQEILKTISPDKKNSIQIVRLNIYRKNGGQYLPKTNKIDYIIQIEQTDPSINSKYTLDLFKDFFKNSDSLSNINSNNKLISTLARVYAEENEFDNCILLNERKGVVGVCGGNFFLVKENIIKTPPLSEGCINGIIRGKVIEILLKNNEYKVVECEISPFEVLKADEIFITNSALGIQPVTNYRKKQFSTNISKKISASLKILEVTSK